MHNTFYRVNFQNIGGARAPDAPIMLGAPVHNINCKLVYNIARFFLNTRYT